MNSTESFVQKKCFAFELRAKVVTGYDTQFLLAFCVQECITNVSDTDFEVIHRCMEEGELHCIHANNTRTDVAIACFLL